MAEAQQLLEQLRQMMENMQVTQGPGGQQSPGQQAMDGLAQTLRDQQGLSDEAFRDLQEQFNQNGQQGQQGEGEGQQGQGEGQAQDGQGGQEPATAEPSRRRRCRRAGRARRAGPRRACDGPRRRRAAR